MSRSEWTLSLVNDSSITIYFIQESNWNIHRTTKTMMIVGTLLTDERVCVCDLCARTRCFVAGLTTPSVLFLYLFRYLPCQILSFSRYTCLRGACYAHHPVFLSLLCHHHAHTSTVHHDAIPHNIPTLCRHVHTCIVFRWLWSPWTILQKLSCDAGSKVFGRFSVGQINVKKEKRKSVVVCVHFFLFFL